MAIPELSINPLANRLVSRGDCSPVVMLDVGSEPQLVIVPLSRTVQGMQTYEAYYRTSSENC